MEEPLRVLFVCSRNQWRSPTAERVWREYSGLKVRSAGVSAQARRRVVEADLLWADVIFAMEQEHKDRLKEKFKRALSGKSIHVLEIPDQYPFMDPALVELFRVLVPQYLGWEDGNYV